MMKRTGNNPHHYDATLFGETRKSFEWSYHKTIEELQGYDPTMHWVIAYSGGKDSTTVVTLIAHAIETDILHISLDQPSQVDENGQVVAEINMTRLQKLTASSMMLSCLWEARTYLRRQYGLMNNRRESKGKSTPKDLNKAPVKVQGVNGDRFWEEISTAMSAFESKESMMNQCRSFVELLNIDEDFKIAAEADEDGARLSTPNDDETGIPDPPGGSGRGRKRKASGTPGNQNKRARSSSVPRQRGRPKSSGKKGERMSADCDDGDGEG